MFFFDIKSLYSSSAFSNIAITFLLTHFSRLQTKKRKLMPTPAYSRMMTMLWYCIYIWTWSKKCWWSFKSHRKITQTLIVQLVAFQNLPLITGITGCKIIICSTSSEELFLICYPSMLLYQFLDLQGSIFLFHLHPSFQPPNTMTKKM